MTALQPLHEPPRVRVLTAARPSRAAEAGRAPGGAHRTRRLVDLEVRPATDPRRRPLARITAVLPFGFAAVALACLPPTVAGTSLSEMRGLGLAGVLPVWAWAALGAAVLAAATELLRARPRPALLIGLTGLLILCTTGLPSLVEPTARLPTAWTHSGFIQAIAATGELPVNIDSRFSWAGFFSQWAWIAEAAGGMSFDGILRWAPCFFVAAWAVGTYAVARPLVGSARAAWAATWLMLGINWIEQDYFSPQATAIVMSFGVIAVVVGPLAAHRADPAPGDWLCPTPERPTPERPTPERRLPVTLRAMVAARTPVQRPALESSTVLVLWACVALAFAAIVVEHQLTPFALCWQLMILALAGLFWGRWLIAVLAVLLVSWFVLGAAEFWESQLDLATQDVGDVGGSLLSALFDRLVGDTGQLVVKYGRIGLAAATWLLALVGAYIRWRRNGSWLLVALAAVPAGLVFVQSYGGEILLRVMLFGMPFLVVLGAEAIRATGRRWPRASRPVLVLGLAGLLGVLVVLRGGNDAYVGVTAHDVQVEREILATAPPGDRVLPLANQGPSRLARAGDVPQITSTPGCEALADDPVGCVSKERPYAVIVLPSMDAEGVWLDGRPPGWTRAAVDQILSTGWYRVERDEGLTVVLVRTVPR